MARIFSKINNKINYTIFDTKPVNLLQFYYLKLNLNVGFDKEQIKLISKIKTSNKKLQKSLFIANWSINLQFHTFLKNSLEENTFNFFSRKF